MLEMFSQQLPQRKEIGAIIPTLEIFEHVQQHEQFFQAMLRGHAGEVFWEAAQTTLSKVVEQTLSTIYAENASPAISWAVIASYVTGSILTLLKWWLRAEMPYSPEQMEKIFLQLVFAWSIGHCQNGEYFSISWSFLASLRIALASSTRAPRNSRTANRFFCLVT
jgi:hypothetical protein